MKNFRIKLSSTWTFRRAQRFLFDFYLIQSTYNMLGDCHTSLPGESLFKHLYRFFFPLPLPSFFHPQANHECIPRDKSTYFWFETECTIMHFWSCDMHYETLWQSALKQRNKSAQNVKNEGTNVTRAI